MKVYEAIEEALRLEGVECVFAVMGDGNMRFLAELTSRTGIDVVFARHEVSAVAMADGYARASGGVGVCSVTSGPGIALAALPLLTAARRRSPLILLAGDTAVGDNGRIQNMDQSRFIQGLDLESVDLLRPVEAVHDLRSAFESADGRSEPVVVQIPMDVQDADFAGSIGGGSISPRTRRARPSIRPGPIEIDRSMVAIEAARRRVIVAGRGAAEDGAGPAIERLAALLDAPVFTSLPARGLISDDSPWSAGVAGNFGSPESLAVLRDADLAIVIGAGLGSHTTGRGALFGEARLVRIDLRPSAGAWAGATTVSHLQGSARLTTEVLIDAVTAADPTAQAARTTPSAPIATRALSPVPPEMVDDRLHPGFALHATDGTIPDDATVVVGVGHFFAFVVEHLRVAARRFVFTHDFGAIGQGLPMAIGIAKTSGRRTFAIEGDASIIMSAQELDTAARYRLPVTVVVVNDEALGAEYHKLRSHGVDPGGSVMRSPDLAAVAEGFGAQALTVRTPDELHRGLLASTRADGPFLLDVRVSREVVSQPYQRLHSLRP